MKSELKFENAEIAKKLANYKMPRYNELTSFPVVMRQLVKILDDYLEIFLVPGEDKMLTQPMINSYVYKKIIEAPKNKEYTRNHIVYLLVLGMLKQVLSISEIAKLLEMQTKQYPLEIAYNYFCDEIENALKTTFSTRNFTEIGVHNPKKKTLLSESIRSSVLAFTNAIYVKQSLYYKEHNS